MKINFAKILATTTLILLIGFIFATVTLPALAQESTGGETTGGEATGSYGERIKIPNPLNPGESAKIEKKDYANLSQIDAVDAARIAELSARVSRAMIAPIGGLAFLVFVIGGFYWIFSAGNEERIKRGRDIMFWAVVGITVVFASYAILSFFFKIIGIEGKA